MVSGDEALGAEDAAAAAEDVKRYLRIGHDDEDGLVAALAGSGAALCEAFTRQALIARSFSETLAAAGCWTRLTQAPVRSIASVARLAADGSEVPLGPADHAIDIDAAGDGWVKAGGGGRIVVRYEAGLASGWETVPEALRQGVVRLAAHLHAHRDEADGRGPPPAVTALWRPWRRMRLG